LIRLARRAAWTDVVVPALYPQEFRDDVARVTRDREGSMTLAQIAKDFGTHEMTLSKWLLQVHAAGGEKPGTTRAVFAENGELKKRIRLFEQEKKVCGERQPTSRERICRPETSPARETARRNGGSVAATTEGASTPWMETIFMGAMSLNEWTETFTFDTHVDRRLVCASATIEPRYTLMANNGPTYWHISEPDVDIGRHEAYRTWADASIPFLKALASGRHNYITYGAWADYVQVRTEVYTSRSQLSSWPGEVLGQVLDLCYPRGMPALSSLVVNQETGMCGTGFGKYHEGSGIDPNNLPAMEAFAAKLRTKCFVHYARPDPLPMKYRKPFHTPIHLDWREKQGGEWATEV
jgi:hypothetical protein